MIHNAAHALKAFFHEHAADLWKGGIGTVTPFSVLAVISLSTVEQWLRIFSLCGGVVVAVVTTWSIIRKAKREDQERRNSK